MKPRRLKPGMDFDPVVDPMAPSDYAIRAILDGLDSVASEMERKWGVGRLRLLVSDFLRAKFDAQKDKLDAAIATDQERYVRVHAEGMKRAWVMLDKTATGDGHKPLSPKVWECVLPASKEVVSIVRTEAEAGLICQECRVFTLEEVGHVIEALGDTVLEVKRTFPGATIQSMNKPDVDWEKGDEIPF